MISANYSISDLKKELPHLSTKELQELCLRLAKYKKDNKEFLSYLLFDSKNTVEFLQKIKNEIETAFEDFIFFNAFTAKKTIRKILKFTTKNIKFAASKQIEVELLICFCMAMKNKNKLLNKHPVIDNIFTNQLKKIEKAFATLHEDLQYDYKEDIEILQKSI